MKIISDGITTITNFKDESNAQRRVVLNAVNTVDVRKNYYQRKMLAAQESSTIFPAVLLCGILGASPYIKSKSLALWTSLLALTAFGYKTVSSTGNDKTISRLSEKEAFQTDLSNYKLFAALDEKQENEKKSLVKNYIYQGFDDDGFGVGRLDTGFMKFFREVRNKEKKLTYPQLHLESTESSVSVSGLFNKINKNSEKYKNNVCTGIGILGALNAGLLYGINKIANKSKFFNSSDIRQSILALGLYFAAAIPVSKITSPKFQANLDAVSRYKAKRQLEADSQRKPSSGIFTDMLDYFKNKNRYLKYIEASEKRVMLGNAAVKEVDLSQEQENDAKEMQKVFLDSVKKKGVYNLNKTNFISNMFFNAALLPIIYYTMTKACQQGFSMNKYIKQALMSVGAVSALASLTYSTTKTDLK